MNLKFELDVIKAKRNTMVEYLTMKVREEDWHAVAGAAMDLREIEVELKIAKKMEETYNENLKIDTAIHMPYK